MNILINAYAISPIWGSEPGMGWNWVCNLARYCNLFIITEGEWQKEIECSIEAALKGDMLKDKNPTGLTREQAKHMHFYYSNVTPEVRAMCWNQGDWRFYKYYRQWQYKTLDIAKSIIEKHQIDVLHQLNMIGFREPGLLWKIKDIPFVWGPIGGMEMMPTGFLTGEPIKMKLGLYLKNFINNLQRHYQPNVLGALKRANGMSCATKGVFDFVKNYHKKDCILLNETGCYERELPVKSIGKETFDVIWVGKFDYRKQLGLALESVAQLKDCKQLKLHVIGPGTDEEIKRYHKLADQLCLGDSIIWHGRIPNAEVQEIMRNSDLYLFTSIMEGTPHVVLEAIQNALPVVCFDACGQSGVVNDKVGIKIPLTNKKQAIADFAQAIRNLYNDRHLLKQMSLNCNQRQKELSWDSKAQIMVTLYEKAIERFKNKRT